MLNDVDKSKEFMEFYYIVKKEYLSNRKTIFEIIEKKIIKILKNSNHIIYFHENDFFKFLNYFSRFINISEDFILSSTIKYYFNTILNNNLNKV